MALERTKIDIGVHEDWHSSTGWIQLRHSQHGIRARTEWDCSTLRMPSEGFALAIAVHFYWIIQVFQTFCTVSTWNDSMRIMLLRGGGLALWFRMSCSCGMLWEWMECKKIPEESLKD